MICRILRDIKTLFTPLNYMDRQLLKKFTRRRTTRERRLVKLVPSPSTMIHCRFPTQFPVKATPTGITMKAILRSTTKLIELILAQNPRMWFPAQEEDSRALFLLTLILELRLILSEILTTTSRLTLDLPELRSRIRTPSTRTLDKMHILEAVELLSENPRNM